MPFCLVLITRVIPLVRSVFRLDTGFEFVKNVA